jgi:hypothetical protein
MKTIAAFLLAGLLPLWLAGQSTQGTITGRVTELKTGDAIPNSYVSYVFYCRIAANGVVESGDWIKADSNGYYAFPSLSPGIYRLRAQADAISKAPPERKAKAGRKKTPNDFADGDDCFPKPNENHDFQAQEKHDLTLAVAGRMIVDFALLLSVEVADPNTAEYLTPTHSVVRYFGSDARTMNPIAVDTAPASQNNSGSTVSYVVDSDTLERVPLEGRDAYAMLALLPGVTSDTSTSRGLGLSVSGQRPTSSNYLLDGVENNYSLVTGPAAVPVPEMLQEYRISTGSWSAEYGGTNGFLANAITRPGGARWHGALYFDLKNNVLDANTFELNAQKMGRLPFKEDQYGFQTGGPLWKQTLFFSAAFDGYRSRSEQQSQPFSVPSPQLPLFNQNGPAQKLMMQFPTPATTPGDGYVSQYTTNPTVSLNRYVGLARADYVFGQQRVFLRLNVSRFDWPDFVWYPYKQFMSSLTQPVDSLALGYTSPVKSNLTQEFHAGFSRNLVEWDRPYPEIPTLSSNDGVLLPGSPLLYGLRNAERTFQMNDTWSWVWNRHIIKGGGGLLVRSLDNLMTVGQNAEVIFNSIYDFAGDSPDSYSVAVDRISAQNPTLPLQLPGYGYSYRNTQFFLFGEDSWRTTPHLVLNAGLRYENIGAPLNTGTLKNVVVQLGSGTSFPQRLESASLSLPGPGNQQIWSASGNFSPRFGFAWDPGSQLPVIRGGFGIFYDRPFDNLWQTIGNNGLVLPLIDPQTCGCVTGPKSYLAPPQTILANYKAAGPVLNTFPSLLLMDPHLKNGYTQSYFLSLAKTFSASWDAEVMLPGSDGRRLLTSDILNRNREYIAKLPDIVWRSDEGSSSYHALTSVLRYRAPRGTLQLSYTWSHSIDNQSDPLGGDYFDLGFVNVASPVPPRPAVSFSQEFDSAADRGNSDFDQRHNLVFYSWFDLPSAGRGRVATLLLRNWRFSQVAAFRSGFPYTVYELIQDSNGTMLSQRAALVPGVSIAASPGSPAKPGSIAVLNQDAFTLPTAAMWATGRNAFAGPGLWNIDVSLSRTIPLKLHREASRLVLRADFFNALNHANLNPPDSQLQMGPCPASGPCFGQASYGRLDYASGFPALLPLNETPRQVQILLRFEF